MLHPAAAYRRLAQDYPAVHPAAALRRPALAALVAGTAVGIAATGRATAPLVLSAVLCWGFAVAWQVIAAAVALRSRHAVLTFGQRLDLFFAGQAPWSLWLLTASAWSRVFPGFTDLYAVLCTVAVPAAWTSVVVYGFCTGALGLPRPRALRLTIVHQALIWGFAFVCVTWAVALGARLLGTSAS